MTIPIELLLLLASGVLFLGTMFNTYRQIKNTPPVAVTATMSDAEAFNAMLRLELEPVRRDLQITNQWVQMLVVQVVSLGGQPVTHADAERAYSQAGNGSDPSARLRAVLAARFDFGEMRALVSDLGWRIENIAGEGAPMPDVAARVVDYARVRGQVNRLSDLVYQRRPSAPEWLNAE